VFTLAGLQPELVDAFPKAPARTDERNQALHILGLYVVPLANRLALTALLSELDEQIIIIRDLAEKASAGRSPRAFDDLRQQLIRTGTDSQVINDIVNYAEDTTWWKHKLIDFSEAPPPILGQITPQASLADTLRRGQIAEGSKITQAEADMRALLSTSAQLTAASENIRLQRRVWWLTIVSIIIAAVAAAAAVAELHTASGPPAPAPARPSVSRT
jgi:hypothetical protein